MGRQKNNVIPPDPVDEIPDDAPIDRDAIEATLPPEPQETTVEIPPTRNAPVTDEDDVEYLKPTTSTQKKLGEQLAFLMGAATATIAGATRHSFWYLSEQDNENCGQAIANVIPSLPKKQAEFIIRNVPIMNLGLTLGSVFLPRIMMEIEIRKAEARGVLPQNYEYVAPPAPAVHVPPPPPPARSTVKPAASNGAQEYHGAPVPGANTDSSVNSDGKSYNRPPSDFIIPGLNDGPTQN